MSEHQIERTSFEKPAAPVDSLGGDFRMSLFQQFDRTVGGARNGSLSGDSALPTELRFTGDIYGSASKGDSSESKIQTAALKESITPDPERSSPLDRAREKLVSDATKFAFGDADGSVARAEGRAALETIISSAYASRGEQGLKDVATYFNDTALDKYGERAFA